MLTFSWDWVLFINLAVAVLLPLLVGLVTTKVTSSSAKALLLAGLNLLSALLVEVGQAIARNEVIDLGVWLLTFIGQYIIAVATHFGLWRPTGATEAAQNAGRRGYGLAA